MIPLLYRGSVKDLMGPVPVSNPTQHPTKAVIFDYSDAFSVFDWGRLTDLLPRKGEALATLAAEIFEKLENPQTWREFSRSPEALAMRKANRFGAVFNEIGEELQAAGLRTHYLGVLETLPSEVSTFQTSGPKKLSEVHNPIRRLVVKQVSAVKPNLTSVLGRSLPDYYPTRTSPLPRLVPLEVVFRMSCPEGSSLFDRVNRDSGYMASLGFPDVQVNSSARWDFPVLELFTKLESTDRPVSLPEALAISGLSAGQLQEVLLKTAWVAGLLKYWCAKLGLELADGKLEWALGEDGKCFLVDAIGPDELRILKDGIQLSKEFLRSFYKTSAWYESVEKAKAQAKKVGAHDWKKWVPEIPPTLTAQYRELAIQVYLSLANELSGRKWFADASGVKHVIAELKSLKEELKTSKSELQSAEAGSAK
ncbi:MAG: phosphoribosylaminoimidazolesuccinocarboxamide synthase [Bdellovibrionia bacterium]